MDNFIVIYKILKSLEKAMDLSEFDISEISWEALRISENRWYAIMEMLIKKGYIEGVQISRYLSGNVKVINSGIRITLDGLEYLNDNTVLKRAIRAFNGAKEIKSNFT